ARLRLVRDADQADPLALDLVAEIHAEHFHVGAPVLLPQEALAESVEVLLHAIGRDLLRRLGHVTLLGSRIGVAPAGVPARMRSLHRMQAPRDTRENMSRA